MGVYFHIPFIPHSFYSSTFLFFFSSFFFSAAARKSPRTWPSTSRTTTTMTMRCSSCKKKKEKKSEHAGYGCVFVWTPHVFRFFFFPLHHYCLPPPILFAKLCANWMCFVCMRVNECSFFFCLISLRGQLLSVRLKLPLVLFSFSFTFFFLGVCFVV